MAEQTVPLNLPPGLSNNGTVYQTKGRWHDGNLVRFFSGNIQPVGGWSQRTLTGATIAGTVAASVSWVRLDDTTVLAVATDKGLYIVDSSNFVTRIHDTSSPALGTVSHWRLDVFGGYLVYSFYASASAGGLNVFYVWDGVIVNAPVAAFNDTLASPANSVPYGPTDLFTTPEYFCVALGAADQAAVLTDSDAVRDPRLVWWASQATALPEQTSSAITPVSNPNAYNWTPLTTNSAGSFQLQTKGSLVCGIAARGLSLLWTTVDVWGMTYIGGTLIYRFDKLGDGCGIVAARAMAVLDNMTLWMGNSRFFSYNGYVQPLPCEVQDYVFTQTSSTGLNQTYADLTWALHNPAYSEVTWFYVAGSSNSTINAYVTYNYVENHWTYGSLARNTGVSFQQPGVVPVLIDASGNIYDHETGNSRGGATPYLESGPIELGLGDVVYRVQHVVPDDKTVGDVQMRFYTSFYPDAAETLSSAISLAALTSVRLTARQMRVRLEEVNATSWRVGNIRLKVVPGGKR